MPVPDEIIEELYHRFAAYQFAPDFANRCSPLTPPDEATVAALNQRLRTISDEQLSRYAFKANSTWGDETDFRHFLPRLYELLATDGYTWGPEQLISKTLYCGLRSWPEKEQETIAIFFEALWEARWYRCDESWLVALLQLKPITHWLDRLDMNDRSPERLEWVVYILGNFWYLKNSMDEYDRNALRDWLLLTPWEDALTTAFFAATSEQDRRRISEAEQTLRFLRAE